MKNKLTMLMILDGFGENENDKANQQKIKNMLQTMEQFKQMRPILEMMSQNTGTEQSEDNYMDILKGFLSEDQLFMFDMFNSQVNNSTDI